MKKYELTLIVGEDHTENKAADIIADIVKLIEEKKGTIARNFTWGKKKLAYPIRKNNFGYYFILIFTLDPSLITELTRELNLHNKIIRYLITDFVDESFFEEQEAGETQDSKENRDEEDEKEGKRSLASDPAIQEGLSAMHTSKGVAKKKKEIIRDTQEETAADPENLKEVAKEEKQEEMSDADRKATLDKKLAEILGEE